MYKDAKARHTELSDKVETLKNAQAELRVKLMMSGEETLAAREDTLNMKSEVAKLRFAQLEQNQARLTSQLAAPAPAAVTPAPAPEREPERMAHHSPAKKKLPPKAKPAKALEPESESEDEPAPAPAPAPEPEPEAKEPLMNDDDLNELERALSERYVPAATTVATGLV